MRTCAQCRIKYPDALEFCPNDGTRLGPAAAPPGTPKVDPYIGTIVDGRYRMESRLGEGGMGLVYAARHVIIDKRFAIKVLKHEAQEDPTAPQRFIQEAKAASKIGHANIVDISDFGVLTDGSAYFVMEFLEGRTLGQVIDQGPLSSRRVISIAAQMARGLHAAHQKGIIHRDLKPDNIFLIDKDGLSDVVKIVDFGIAKVQSSSPQQKLTQVGMVLGTPEYMSPEQATGKETDYRVDEYALGCIMYEMLTGEVPFRGDNSTATLTKHVFDAAEPPRQRRPDLNISPAIEAVVLKAMAKVPADRYPTMRELLAALDQAGLEITSGRDEKQRPSAPPPPERSKPTWVNEYVSPGQEEPTKARGRRLPSRKTPRLRAGRLLIALGLPLVALGAVLASSTLSRRSSGPAPKTIAAAPSDPEPVAPPPVEKPPAEARLNISSVPPGAAVFIDSEHIGTAPMTYTHPLGSTPLVFTFRMPGYEEARHALVPDQSRDVEVVLNAKTQLVHKRPRAVERPVVKPAPQRKVKLDGELRDPF